MKDTITRLCKMEAQCKGGVRADGVSSLIVAAGERRSLLVVGFENMMHSWVMKSRRGPAGTERGGVLMAWGREGQGTRNGNGVRGHHLTSPPCFV